MAETIGERDEDFLAELQSAGYTADTIALAELIPQIQIVWADDRVSKRERDVILEAAAHRGVPPHGRLQLARWLEHPPSERLFRISLQAIKQMLRRLPIHVQANVRGSLLREYAAIAGASGGFLWWGSVSAEKRRMLDSFTSELDTPPAPETWSR